MEVDECFPKAVPDCAEKLGKIGESPDFKDRISKVIFAQSFPVESSVR